MNKDRTLLIATTLISTVVGLVAAFFLTYEKKELPNEVKTYIKIEDNLKNYDFSKQIER